MPKPTSSILESRGVRLALAALVIGATTVTAIVSCTTESGTTPTCVQDEDDAGHHVIDGGCNPHAICTNEAGSKAAPLTCCTGLSELDLASCLIGYDATCTDTTGAVVDAKQCCQAFLLDGGSDTDFCLHGFSAQCFDPAGTGKIVPAAQCCTGKTGSQLAYCLYAYGGALPVSGGGGSTP